jgi:class 3 adenylate cyclase
MNTSRTGPNADLPGVPQELVLALLSVDGASAACATHGDAATVAVLATYYAIVADAIAATGGDVIKVMGDGVLVAFPIERARDAVAALHVAQERAGAEWRGFDARCSVVVRVTAGRVLRVSLGPPGAERPDLYGHALNQLYRLPAGEFVVAPQLAAKLA